MVKLVIVCNSLIKKMKKKYLLSNSHLIFIGKIDIACLSCLEALFLDGTSDTLSNCSKLKKAKSSVAL